MNGYRDINEQGQVSHDINAPRSVFNRSSTLKTTFNAGQAIPLYLDEVYPGDTIKMEPHFILRGQTPLTPVMDNSNLDLYWFFVPMRQIWEAEYDKDTGEMIQGGWKNFMGENGRNHWTEVHTLNTPKISTPSGGWDRGSLADYLGLPINQTNTTGDKINHLPFRAYCHIWNEWFRDQNYQDPIQWQRYTKEVLGQKLVDSPLHYITGAQRGGNTAPVNKYHDYFTSCLPSPLKHAPVGASVKVPDIEVITGGEHQSSALGAMFRRVGSGVGQPLNVDGTNANNVRLYGLPQDTDSLTPTNLWAQASTKNVELDIQELRDMWAVAKVYERDARHGTRYNEMVKAHWSVVSPDLELQRPEYLGGCRTPININQVEQTAQATGTTPADKYNATLGATGAYSHTQSDALNNSGGFTKSFTEHGYIMCIGCVRTEQTYYQGYNRLWQRDERLDFYTPEMANISEQPVYTKEIYSNINTPNDVWGFQEAWAELRYKPNQITGWFRQGNANEFGESTWHYATHYETKPTMSGSWLYQLTEDIDRTTVIGAKTPNTHQYKADIYFKTDYTRALPTYSVPSLVDHI